MLTYATIFRPAVRKALSWLMIVACEGLARGSYSTWLVRLVAYLGCRCHLAWVSGLVKAAAMWADTQIVSSHSCFISTF